MAYCWACGRDRPEFEVSIYNPICENWYETFLYIHRIPAPKSVFFMIEDRGSPDGSAIEETENKSQSSSSNDKNDEKVEIISQRDSPDGASSEPAQQVTFEYQRLLQKINEENKKEVEKSTNN